MTAPADDARSLLAAVQRLESCGEDAVELVLCLDEEPGPIRPSRFFMLRREDGLSPLLPRPFSLYRRPAARQLSFLIKVIGSGTRALAASRPGERLRLIGPLGNGWPTLDGEGPPWVLVAGGIGSAPFYLAIEEALAGMDGRAPVAPRDLTMIYGAARAGLHYDLERFRALGATVRVASDDGSAGFAGNSVQLLEELFRSGQLPPEVRLLACGPEPMLRAVQDLALARGLECWLSLETLMGCGVGICNGCPVPTRADGPRGDWPNLKCCVDGPVFGVHEVDLAHQLV